MAIRTLNVTGLTIAGRGLDATGRLMVSTIGDDRSWKATVGLVALPELGPKGKVEPVVISTTQGRTLSGNAYFEVIDQSSFEGKVWLSVTGSGPFEVVGRE